MSQRPAWACTQRGAKRQPAGSAPELGTCPGMAARRLCRDVSFRFGRQRSEEHTSELQSLMRISYAVFCLKKKNTDENATSKEIATTLDHHRLLTYKNVKSAH